MGFALRRQMEKSVMKRPHPRMIACTTALLTCTGIATTSTGGEVVTWGDDNFGQCATFPEADFKSISAGHAFSLGILSEGRLVGWGSNHRGQIQIPEPVRQFVAVSAGVSYSIGLTERRYGCRLGWIFRTVRSPPMASFRESQRVGITIWQSGSTVH